MARKKLSAEKQMNMISGLQIRFNKLKKKLECWAVPYQLMPFPRNRRQ